jgi:hypothetical protein
MADKPSPRPPEAAEPAPPENLPAAPVATAGPVAAEPTAEPGKGRPVVLATPRSAEFIVPAPVDDDGKPTGEEIHVTPAGVALSKKDAERVTEAARRCGVTLIERDS